MQTSYLTTQIMAILKAHPEHTQRVAVLKWIFVISKHILYSHIRVYASAYIVLLWLSRITLL